MKVTLIRPPYGTFLDFHTLAHPIALGYLSASLANAGHEVGVVDAEMMTFSDKSWLETKSDRFMEYVLPEKLRKRGLIDLEKYFTEESEVGAKIAEKTLEQAPDMVGIQCFTACMTTIFHICRELLRRKPDLKVVLGGIHIANMAERTLEDIPGLTCVVIGEGERTVVELARELEKNDPDLGNVLGIAFMKDGKAVRTGPRALEASLDDLPLATRSWPGVEYNYHYAMSSRGCPFSCVFCDAKSIMTRKVRNVSVERVVEELEVLASQGVPYIRFTDDTFTVNPKRVSAWCKKVIESGLNKKLKFSCGTRVELITKQRVEEYAEAGIVNMSFGIETGSKRISQLIAKEFKNTDPYEALKMANDAGISTRTFFMVGHPTETVQDSLDTMRLAEKLASLPRNDVQFGVVLPFPGTQLWPLALQKNGGKEFVDMQTYYKMIYWDRPLINLSAMTDEELETQIRAMFDIASSSGLSYRLKTLARRMMDDPVSTTKFLKFKLFGRALKS